MDSSLEIVPLTHAFLCSYGTLLSSAYFTFKMNV